MMTTHRIPELTLGLKFIVLRSETVISWEYVKVYFAMEIMNGWLIKQILNFNLFMQGGQLTDMVVSAPGTKFNILDYNIFIS